MFLMKYSHAWNKKCSFAQKSVVYLGHRLDAEDIHPTSEKLKAIIEAQKPCDVKQLHSYLELINYYVKFVPRTSTVLRPLYLLLMKHVVEVVSRM